MSDKVLGIVGGSGLYDIEGVQNIQKHKITTAIRRSIRRIRHRRAQRHQNRISSKTRCRTQIPSI